jgi:CBS domain-containing membrane protein
VARKGYSMPDNLQDFPPGIDLKDEDICEAMRAIPGYLDITPGDFKEVYRLAFQHALERLSRAVTAAEIMTTDVVAVSPDTPVAEVAAAMGRRGVSGVPVVDAGHKVVGVISEKDFLSRMGVVEPRNFMNLVAGCLITKGCVALPLKRALAADIMTSPAVTAAPDTPVRDIAALLTQKAINRVAVTDPSGRLLGLVSRADIVKATVGRGPS